MRVVLLSLLLACTLPAAEPLGETHAPAAFVIGLSPFLANSVKDDVYRSVVRLLVQDLPLNSTLTIYDAYALKSITRVDIPQARAFESPKTRANQFAASIRELKRFLAQPHPWPSAPRLKFDEALHLPQFCDFLAENLPAAENPANLLLIGSPLYLDEKEPDFSMVDGYFPSDGHLQASREKSIFGRAADAGRQRALVVHWVYFSDPWVSDLYQEKVTRFWTLYLQGRGDRLVSISGDLPSALQGFRERPTALPAVAHHWSIDSEQTKIEMLRIGREVDLADWIQRDSILESPSRAPSLMLGPLKIGIRWKDNIDLDLYAAPRPGAETLFFQHPRSPEGYYDKDHRSSPGREYEFIEFEKPVDIREVQAFVNFYKGSCPSGPRGEVRIEFDGRIYSAPFSIAASSGNRGRTGSAQDSFWDRIPVQSILKLTSPTPAQ